MAELFETDRTSIVRHINNIYKGDELDRESTCAKIAQVQIEGKRAVKRNIPRDDRGRSEPWHNSHYSKKTKIIEKTFGGNKIITYICGRNKD